MHIKKPLSGKAGRIDIYVDGSWLSKGQKNPVETGGWGAIIVDSYHPDHPRYLSGPVSETAKSAADAENEAILNALESVQLDEYSRTDRPMTICLHTDQIDHVRGRGNASSNGIVSKIRGLADSMGVRMTYTSDPKLAAKGGRDKPLATRDQTYMSGAHELARYAAWTSRLDKQGYIFQDNVRIEGDEARKMLSYQASSVMPERYKPFTQMIEHSRTPPSRIRE